MTDLHALLTERTRQDHRQLDDAIAASGMLDSAEGYRSFLQGWYRLQAGVEEQLERSGVEQLLPDWPLRRRAHLIARDLAGSGVPVPDVPRTEPALTPAGVLGTAYVVEGATLGAAVLLPAFRKRGIVTDENSSFLSMSVDARTTLWSAFLEVLRRQAAHVNDDAVVEAARTTFARARTCFSSGARET